MRVIVLHPHTKFDVRRPSRSENMDVFRSQALSGLSISKWDHGHPYHELPFCQFSSSFRSRLRVRHVTDRRTEKRRPSTPMPHPHPMRAGPNNFFRQPISIILTCNILGKFLVNDLNCIHRNLKLSPRYLAKGSHSRIQQFAKRKKIEDCCLFHFFLGNFYVVYSIQGIIRIITVSQ